MSKAAAILSSTAPATEDAVFHRFGKLPPEIRLKIWKMALPGPCVVLLQRKALKKTVGDWERENKAKLRGDIFQATSLGDTLEDRECKEHDLSIVYSLEYQDLRENNGNTPTAELPLSGASSNEKLVGFASGAEPPAILFVCWESHLLAAKYYKCVFSAAGSFPQTYFDFEIDTLYLGDMDNRGRSGLFLETELLSTCTGLWALDNLEDMSRVKNLAIQYPEAYIDNDLIYALPFVLRKFRNVENLSIVRDRVMSGFPEYICSDSMGFDQTRLRLTPPRNINRFIKMHEDFLKSPQSYIDKPDINAQLDEDWFWDKVNTNEIVQELKDESKFPPRGILGFPHNPGWKIPQVTLKTCVDEQTQQNMDRLSAAFDAIHPEDFHELAVWEEGHVYLIRHVNRNPDSDCDDAGLDVEEFEMGEGDFPVQAYAQDCNICTSHFRGLAEGEGDLDIYTKEEIWGA